MSAAHADNGLPARLAERLRRRPPALHAEWDATPAAVLVPLYRQDDAWHVLFTRRTDLVDVHRGQVSFPGGRIEPGDAGPEQAALREAEEELGLAPDQVSLLGRLDTLLTITRFRVEPVVGVLRWPAALRPNPQEVARAFGVPLAWLAEPANLEREDHPAPEGPPIPVYSFRAFRGEVVWGATARITLSLLEALRAPSP